MDISLNSLDNNSNKYIKPISVHGMLWLQTHFENEHWEALADNRVILSEIDSKFLIQDANAAGISVKSTTEISKLDILPKIN